MKFTRTAAAALLVATLGLAGCSGEDKATETASPSSSKVAPAKGAATAQPTAADLNAVLAKATDPNAQVSEKILTVQGGDTAPELFETMTASKSQSGADFQVVDPILPGYTPDSVLATVNFTLPDREPQAAENVEFIFEGGNWKLSQSWACTLITNTVPAEQVPPMCQEQGATPAK